MSRFEKVMGILLISAAIALIVLTVQALSGLQPILKKVIEQSQGETKN